MTFDSEGGGDPRTSSTKATDDDMVSPVKFRNNHITRITKEENRRSLPLLSIHSAHHSARQSTSSSMSSENFEETMKLNAPYISRSKSPKSRHKNRQHHNKQASSVPHKSLSRFDAVESRSYSDSAIQVSHNKHSHKPNDISHWNYLNPRELKRSSVIEHKDGETACHAIVNGFSSSKVENMSIGNSQPCDMIASIKSNGVDHETDVRRPSFGKLSVKNFQRSDTIVNAETMLPRIEEFENVCRQNYENIISEIHSEFAALTKLIDERKKVLIDTATTTHKRKLYSLNELKTKWKNTKESTIESISTHPSPSPSLHKLHANENMNGGLEQQNGIKEPWEVVTKSENTNSFSKHSNGEDTPLSGPEKLLSSDLEEGNLTFLFNKDDCRFISSLGKIEENLSSPQYSFLTGYPLGNILVGDTVHMQVHTRNPNNEETHNSKDEVELSIYDQDKKIVRLESIPDVAQKLEHILMFAEGNNDSVSEQKHHSYAFKPTRAGHYDVVVKVNGIAIKSSPYKYVVYAKQSLTFQNNRQPDVKPHRSLSSECDDVINCASQHDWIVKKDGKSSLLRTQGDKICQIYADQTVRNTNAWKIRLTSACIEIVFSVGVATRTGVPQIDEQFSCQFYLKEFQKKINRDRNVKRRESSFTRPPITFSLLFNDGYLRVTSHELGEDKHVAVRLSIDKSNDLYPFCSMVHCHDEFFSQVCPSPQITFL